MATNKRFTDLPAVTSLSDNDIIPVTASSATSKITKANLKTTLGVPLDTGDLTNDEGFITNISSQDLSTADNSTSAFITLSEVPPTDLVNDLTPQLGGDLDGQSTYKIENVTTVNGVELVSGTGGIVVGDNTLTVAGGDMTLTGAGTGTITVPDATGTMALTSDLTSFITDISSQDLSTADNSTSAFITSADIPASIADVVEDTTPQLGGNLDLNQFNVKLITAPSSDHTVSGTIIALTAHENQAFGDVCYIASDGQAQLIDADAIATMSAVVMCADATIAGDASGNYLLMGIARDDSWNWTVGGLIYGTVTGTSGNTLSQTAPSATDDVIQIMGVATHADRMLFNPSLVQVEHA